VRAGRLDFGTLAFTGYLASQSRGWKEQVGAGLAVRWPTGVPRPLRFLKWSFESGGDLARSGGHVVVPSPLATLVQKAWKRQIKTPSGGPVWTGR
jgi:hypothetical protein